LIICNLSFEVKRGEVLTILGPNGAGNETCGYCLPKKTAPPEFARKVKAICSLPKEEYEKLRKRASKKVQFLDWQEIVPQTIAVYRRLAERETEKNKKFS
jgi:ABC-type multidrug transport system ATPase subunit